MEKSSVKARVNRVPTKYYKATYIDDTGFKVDEVFISDTVDHAKEYASGPNADGRKLVEVLEYNELIDALL